MQAYKSDTIRAPHGLQAIRLTFRLLNRFAPAFADAMALRLFLRVRRKPVNYHIYLPKGAQPIEIVHNLRKLKGYKWGNGAKTVLLVHGWESHLGQMLPLVEPLVAQGFSVIAFDAPGHGASPSQPTHLQDFMDAIEDVIVQHGPVEAIIAHSFGAAATVLRLAQASKPIIKKLVLLSPMTQLDDHVSIYSRIAALPFSMMLRLRTNIASQIGAPVEHFNAIAAAEKMYVETLVLHDEDDQTIPVMQGRQVAEALRAWFISTKGLGHRGLLRDIAVIDMVNTFLSAQPAAPELAIYTAASTETTSSEYETLRTA